mmetsp:Transcript_34608/g.98060  ORF Transcript_34608/g.98060 Transcript_34608/m.98060 type:complete len:704 (+) Transcript_34608:873-2984(+)
MSSLPPSHIRDRTHRPRQPSSFSSQAARKPSALAAMAPRMPTDPDATSEHDFSPRGSIHMSLESLEDEGRRCPVPNLSIPPLDPDACTLRIFAINDVYMLDHYPHLKACIDAHRNGPNTVVTLAGDFLAPSLLSGLDQGHGAVDVMNAAGITHVCFGNHECDVPYPDMLRRIDESHFTWLSTNMRDLEMDGRQALPEHDIITVRGPGQERRVGLLGFLTDDPGLYRLGSYAGATIDPVPEALERSWAELEAMGVDAIIPLTHQDMPDDIEMALRWGPWGSKWSEEGKPSERTAPLSVILGGHDHEIMYETVAGCQIIKAGAEAENIAVIDVVWPTPDSARPVVHVSLVDALDFPADPSVSERVAGHYTRVEEVKRAPLCPIPEGVKLSSKDARFKQTTVGTLLCSAMRDGFVADGCIFNGGGVRANRDYGSDTEFFFLSDLESEMPFNNELVCVEMPGRVLSDIVAYTRSFASKDPPVEYGGFMQIDDGMRFCDKTFCVTHVKNKPIDYDKSYSIVVTLIHMQGIDSIPPMVDFAKSYPFLPADGIPCKMVIVNYFSRLMWLMMGSWADLNRFDSDYITREAFLATAKTKFDVDFVVDQVFNRCDFDGDGRVSKADIVAAVLFTGFLFDKNHDGVLDRGQVRAFAKRVLGCEVEEEVVQQVMSTFDTSGDGVISVDELRKLSHPVDVGNSSDWFTKSAEKIAW